jgi:peptidoglycan hydrolase CwlO-like protein
MKKRFITSLFIIIGILFSSGSFLSAPKISNAQTALENAQVDRAALEAELKKLEAEIAAKQKELSGQKNKSLTLQNEVNFLKTKIDSSKLNIKSKDLTISKLKGEIGNKSQKIETLEEKIDKEKESLAQLVRKTRELDDRPFVHLVAAKESLSQFYTDVDSFASIKSSIKQSVNAIRGVKAETEEEKKDLELKREQEIDAKYELELAKKKVEADQAEQKRLLGLSKQQETVYQKDLATKQAKAAQIKARLFPVAGGGAAIPFGTAVVYAKNASAKTGIRPAFLLAILEQESGIGKNVGSCYLAVPETGAGIRVATGVAVANVMKPTRDVAPFMTVTSALGLDPFKTRVSCPIPGIGYGGAMGPSQFIPSTWQMLATRIANAVGKSTANPWDAGDAFMASSIYLTDLGAGAKTYTAEVNAACKYYSGRSCATGPGSSYGNSVMTRAASIEADIDYLDRYGVTKTGR